MIRDVEAHLRKQIKASGRSFFAKHFEHKYTITRNVITFVMQPELQEWINDWNEHVEAQVAQAEKDGVNIYEGGPPYIVSPDLAQKAAHAGIEKVLLDANLVRSALTARDKTYPVKVYKRGKYQVVVDISAGYLNKVSKTQNNKYVNIMNEAIGKLYEEARSAAFDSIDIDQAIQTDKRKRSGDTRKLPGRTDTKFAKNRKNPLLRGHGSARAASGQLVAVEGKPQTTVAVLSTAKEWRKFVKGKIKTSVKNRDVLKMMGQVRQELTDALATEYDIHRFTKDSTYGGIHDETVIDLHATDNKGNAALAHYDAKEMRKFINAKATDIKNRLVAEFAHLQPDLETSQTVRNRSEKLQNTLLVESLLGVKGTRPDFRLKVNKRLLTEAKKVLKPTKGNKKGNFQGANRKKKQVTAASVATRKVAHKKPGSKRSEAQARTGASPIALRNLLNEVLPQTVAKNMGSPALNFRTGRFANSARVENVNIGPRGGLHIDYTYMRDPYETFEPGNKQGSQRRDPRRLIGTSIRELAIGMLGQNPTTLRRN